MARTYLLRHVVRHFDTSNEPTAKSANELANFLRPAWHQFLKTFEPLRPDLYRYCRALTRNPWDAEDLVQDTLMRGFATIGGVYPEIRNPKAWLIRVATNLWIDRHRRPPTESLANPPDETRVELSREMDARDAGAELIRRLSPQERAALVLKDVFDFTLEETAEALTTTIGAVKAALHRGRGKLAQEPPSVEQAQRATPGVLNAFCDAFNARDLKRLTALLLETATTEIVGMAGEFGVENMKNERTGSHMLAPV